MAARCRRPTRLARSGASAVRAAGVRDADLDLGSARAAAGLPAPLQHATPRHVRHAAVGLVCAGPGNVEGLPSVTSVTVQAYGRCRTAVGSWVSPAASPAGPFHACLATRARAEKHALKRLNLDFEAPQASFARLYVSAMELTEQVATQLRDAHGGWYHPVVDALYEP